MNAGQKRKEEGAPRWMVTFADLMALLFALFVLLLSFADVNSDSFKKNAGPMRDAFGLGDKILRTTSQASLEEGEAGPGRSRRERGETSATAELLLSDRRLRARRSFLFQFRRVMERQLAAGSIVLAQEDNRIVIRFPGSVAFVPGGAEIDPSFAPALDTVVAILRATKGQILVSGHTDDRPIQTARFRSNWDLSSARAVTVVHHLIERGGISPDRVTAQGFAHSRPLAANDTEAGRANNRRVEIALEITDFTN